MNDPIPVSLARRAVELAIQDCDAATPGPWYPWCELHSANDTRLSVLARAGFRASLEYLRLMLGREDRDYPVNEWISQAVAPLIAHYGATAPGWRTE